MLILEKLHFFGSHFKSEQYMEKALLRKECLNLEFQNVNWIK